MQYIVISVELSTKQPLVQGPIRGDGQATSQALHEETFATKGKKSAWTTCDVTQPSFLLSLIKDEDPAVLEHFTILLQGCRKMFC